MQQSFPLLFSEFTVPKLRDLLFRYSSLSFYTNSSTSCLLMSLIYLELSKSILLIESCNPSNFYVNFKGFIKIYLTSKYLLINMHYC